MVGVTLITSTKPLNICKRSTIKYTWYICIYIYLKYIYYLYTSYLYTHMYILHCATTVTTTATTVTLSATVTNFIYNASFFNDVENGRYFKHKIPIPYIVLWGSSSSSIHRNWDQKYQPSRLTVIRWWI